MKTADVTETILSKSKYEDGIKFMLIDTDQYIYVRYKRKYYRVLFNDEATQEEYLKAEQIEWNPFGYDMAKLNNQNDIPLDTSEVSTWYHLLE